MALAEIVYVFEVGSELTVGCDDRVRDDRAQLAGLVVIQGLGSVSRLHFTANIEIVPRFLKDFSVV